MDEDCEQNYYSRKPKGIHRFGPYSIKKLISSA